MNFERGEESIPPLVMFLVYKILKQTLISQVSHTGLMFIQMDPFPSFPLLRPECPMTKDKLFDIICQVENTGAIVKSISSRKTIKR